jgi:hypothetical protein
VYKNACVNGRPRGLRGVNGERQLIRCAIRADRSYAYLRIRLNTISKLLSQDQPLTPVSALCCQLSSVPLCMLFLFFFLRSDSFMEHRIPQILFIVYYRQIMKILNL